MDTPEQRLIFAADELAEGRAVVRAVIVKTWGSTPREVGADMLLDAQGGLRGTVGGGCGEAEVYELAQQLLQSCDLRQGLLYHVDLTESAEAGGEKVCGGRFDVLLHRLEPSRHGSALVSLREALQRGRGSLWVTDLGLQGPGQWRQGQTTVEISPQVSVRPSLSSEPIWELGPDGHHQFLEPVGRVLRLVIVGAGHIARPLARLAQAVGYRVSVLDDRAEYARSEFFPEAFEVVAGDYEAELPRLAGHPFTSVVLVTRGHKHDQDCLRLMAGMALDYLGMIGSQRRIDAVFAELVQEGLSLELLRQVQAPVGLEIGAQTPAEIAISILAQMIKNRRLGSGADRGAIDRKRHQRSLGRKSSGPDPKTL